MKPLITTQDVPKPPKAFGISLQIDYNRISPNDPSGMVEIECDGPHPWLYSCVGSHHGIQSEGGDEDKTTIAFCVALSRLVREHFGEVVPLQDKPIGKQSVSKDA